jgi:hypothetical protein
LGRKVDFKRKDEHVKPIALPDINEDTSPGLECLLARWGYTKVNITMIRKFFYAEKSDVLKKVYALYSIRKLVWLQIL